MCNGMEEVVISWVVGVMCSGTPEETSQVVEETCTSRSVAVVVGICSNREQELALVSALASHKF